MHLWKDRIVQEIVSIIFQFLLTIRCGCIVSDIFVRKRVKKLILLFENQVQLLTADVRLLNTFLGIMASKY